jgi:hypothetical protein
MQELQSLGSQTNQQINPKHHQHFRNLKNGGSNPLCKHTSSRAVRISIPDLGRLEDHFLILNAWWFYATISGNDRKIQRVR